MPAPTSRKQARYMYAILNGSKDKTSSRGDRVPKSVAAKYVHGGDKADENLPESKGKEQSGGKWSEGHHHKDRKRVEEKRNKRKAEKAKLRKSEGKGAGCLVVDDHGRILLGKRTDNGLWACPGGHVDEGEDFKTAALRELKEEAGILGLNPELLEEGDYHGVKSHTYLVQEHSGSVTGNGELAALQWFLPQELPIDNMTDYTRAAIKRYAGSEKNKGQLKWMVLSEKLQKNIIRSGSAPSNTIFETTHGDALRLVGTGTFRMLKNAVEDMKDEDVKDIKIDTYTLTIRKHVNDVYSGRIVDGHKQVHQFSNKSLPAVAAELMSVFEWYTPEDEHVLESLQDESIKDEEIHGGLKNLIDDYHKHNISNIYGEMEHIRQDIRNGVAVDLQQVEQRIMKLFDKLEESMKDFSGKHNLLASDAGSAIDEIERKLANLQDQIEGMSKKPATVEAYSAEPENPREVHDSYYPYLSRPTVTIAPSGHITISFGTDWTHLEQQNFLRDMKAKAIKKGEAVSKRANRKRS